MRKQNRTSLAHSLIQASRTPGGADTAAQQDQMLEQDLLQVGLEIARDGRDFLNATEGSKADRYSLLVVHESAKEHLPRESPPLIPAPVPGWSTAIFLTDATVRAQAKGKVPAIVMVRATKEAVLLDSDAN